MKNTGKHNNGHRNSGYRNSGYRNSGYRNSGDWNSGDWNSGDWNSGNWNSGYRNSGYRNSGYRNSGDWNSGYRNSGFFNCDAPKTIRVFGRPCDLSRWERAPKPPCLFFELTKWVPSSKMTDQEKHENPDYQTLGGYLKTYEYKEAFRRSMEKATDEEIEQVKALPNFDADIFYEISGYDVRKRNKIKVTANGKEVWISKESAKELGLE